MKKGYSSLLINGLRRVIDIYDQKNNLKAKKVFQCTNLDTRNEKRREEYSIPEDQNQCPVYKDNRCCGCCDYTPTCDYAVNCNCYGFAYACLGGTDEGYYMRDKSYSKYGKIGANGKFDWEYYKDNKKRNMLKVGYYTSLENISKIANEDDINFIKDNNIKYVKILEDVDLDGNVLVDCSIYGIDKEFKINIHFLSEYVKEKCIIENYISSNI